MAQNKTLDPIANAMLKEYEDALTPKKPVVKSTFDLKNYFSTYLPEGVKTGTKQIRILPSQSNGNPFDSMQVHTRQVDGKWLKFTCLKHNSEIDKDCPFCEARQELLASGKATDKELAKKFNNRKMWILRVIDRDDEDHGIKFWRFNDDYTHQGTYDKIMAIVKSFGNISDPEKGRDLIINIGRDQKNNCVITGIVHDDASPALEDKAKLKSLIEDTRIWKDLFSVKEYSYLEIIVLGGVPVYDKENKKWIDKATLDTTKTEDKVDYDQEISMGKDKVSKTESTDIPVIPIENSDEDDSDLPF